MSLILDRSGSMAGAKLEHCKRAARYGVVFNNVIDLLSHHGSLRFKGELVKRIGSIEAGGGTNLSGAWLHGATQVEKSGTAGQVCRLILLTDDCRPTE